MELTGNTLTDFWIWYLLPKQRKTYKTNSLRGGDNVAKIRFLAMSFAERYGVFVDYFNSVGIDIVDDIDSCANDFRYLSKVDFKYIDAHNTRPEARTAAIEKANELRNKQLNDTTWN